MSFFILALVTGCAAVSALALVEYEASRLECRALSRELKDRRDALARTSKLLIDKNMELFDQNLRQQREIETKEDFITIVSHQLRTPATEVKWGIEALSGEIRRKKRRGRELEYFGKLERSAERMVKLIDSLVRLMSADERLMRPGAIAFEPDPIVKAVAAGIAEQYAEKGINLTLVLGAPDSIDTIDTSSLELVVENLIENAYEYTPDKGSVTVSTSGSSGSFACEVRDTGIGVSPEQRERLFSKFQRSKQAVEMNAGGMGLGLYLVKNIIERHGGSVSFTSEEGKGSAFRFVLPAHAPATPNEAPQAPKKPVRKAPGSVRAKVRAK